MMMIMTTVTNAVICRRVWHQSECRRWVGIYSKALFTANRGCTVDSGMSFLFVFILELHI